MTRGKFIVFEGGDGAGKDTLIDLVKKHYAKRDIVYVRDPGGTPHAEYIRDFVLGKQTAGIEPRAELLLFLAARADMVAKVILPTLEAGKAVVACRFSLSTIAYQIYGREQREYLPFLEKASQFANQGLLPDLCILLDVDPKIGLERTTKRDMRLNRFDKEKLAFHERVREGYKKHINEAGKETVVIDTGGTIDEAWKKTAEALQSFL